MMSDAPLSRGNARVKAARKLARRTTRAKARLFLADGPKSVDASPRLERAASPMSLPPRPLPAAHPELGGSRPAIVGPWLRMLRLNLLSDSVNPAGLVAVCRFVDRPLSVKHDGRFAWLAICADVRDPGNAGTVLRTCDAAGGDAIVFAGELRRSIQPQDGACHRQEFSSTCR